MTLPLSKEVVESIEESVLCWLATSNEGGQPNVSPKEVFTTWDSNHMLIADIASPGSVANILCNPRVCVSFIHIFKQKGFKLYGIGNLLHPQQKESHEKLLKLERIAGPHFPINHIIEVKITEVQPILAPSYFLFPDESENDKIAAAHRTYGV